MKGLEIGTRVRVLPFDEIPKETCCYNEGNRTFCDLDENFINRMSELSDLIVVREEKYAYDGSYMLKRRDKSSDAVLCAYDMVVPFDETEIDCGDDIISFLSELGASKNAYHRR